MLLTDCTKHLFETFVRNICSKHLLIDASCPSIVPNLKGAKECDSTLKPCLINGTARALETCLRRLRKRMPDTERRHWAARTAAHLGARVTASANRSAPHHAQTTDDTVHTHSET